MNENKYVIFKLENVNYGIEIEMVKEISEYTKLTKVPNSPPFIEGLLNLRGVIVPVINLKEKQYQLLVFSQMKLKYSLVRKVEIYLATLLGLKKSLM